MAKEKIPNITNGVGWDVCGFLGLVMTHVILCCIYNLWVSPLYIGMVAYNRSNWMLASTNVL